MKAEIVRWGDLAKRDPAVVEGLHVLLDGGLVTVRSLGPGMMSMKNRDSHRLSYKTPWGGFENTTVRTMHFTAVVTDALGPERIDVLGSEHKDQEGK